MDIVASATFHSMPAATLQGICGKSP